MANPTITSILAKNMGLNISSIGQATLNNAVNRRMRALGIHKLPAYIEKLENSAAELNEFINEVVITETWFFRDREPFKVLTNFAARLFKSRHKLPLRILSIPCASGEEPYSIAIALLEAKWAKHDFHIDGIDISSRTLEKARKATYSQHSFRGIDEPFRRRYFYGSKDGFVLDNKIRQKVDFRRGNLLNIRPLPDPADQYHIIFCRNLLIYLDLSSQHKALHCLDNLLAPEGILIIGHAEPGILAGSQFVTLPYAKAFAFCRAKDRDKIQERLAAKENILPGFTPKATGTDPLPPSLQEPQIDEASLSEIEALVREKFFDKAASLCEKYIQNNGPSATVYYLLGIIADESNRHRESVQMLKKAIYLDPDFIEAMALLSIIYRKVGDNKKRIAITQRLRRVEERLAGQKAV